MQGLRVNKQDARGSSPSPRDEQTDGTYGPRLTSLRRESFRCRLFTALLKRMPPLSFFFLFARGLGKTVA